MSFVDDYPLPSQLIEGVSREDISEHLGLIGLRHSGEAFLNCGKSIPVFVDDVCGHRLLSPKAFRCGLKICPECGDSNTWSYLSRLVPALEELGKEREGDGLRFRYFEMGLPRQPYLTTKDIDFISKCFAKFRRSDLWRKQVIDVGGGGFYNIETKFGFKGDVARSGYVLRSTGWNIHVHVFVHSLYLPNTSDKPLLSKMWQYSTGYRASICDYPKEVKNDFRSLRSKAYEVVKYHFKSTDMRTAKNYAVSYDIFSHKKQVRRFGSFRKLKLAKVAAKGHPVCPVCGSDVMKCGSVDRNDVKDVYDDPKNARFHNIGVGGLDGLPLKVKWIGDK